MDSGITDGLWPDPRAHFLISPSLFTSLSINYKTGTRDFPGGAVVKNLPANAGDTGSGPGPGRSHMPWSN